MKNLDFTSKCFIFIIPLITCFSSFVMGYFISYLSMLQSYFKGYHHFNQNEHEIYFTIVISTLPFGGLIGALYYKKFLSAFYQNKLLKIMNFIAIFAILIQIFTIYWPLLIISRFIMGFYCGIISGLVPSYIMSISPSFTSGIIGTFHQTLIVLGMAFAYYMGQYKNYSQYSQSMTTKIIIGFPLIPISVNFVCLCIFPYNNIERYIKKSQNNKIRLYLKMIYGKRWKKFQNEIRLFKMIPTEINYNIKPAIAQENQKLQNQKTWLNKFDCLECEKKKSFILGLMLAATSQLSGSDTILEYVQQLFIIFQDGDKLQADKRVMILGFFQFFVTFISGFIINKVGRRPMMLCGMGIVLISLLLGFLITFLVDEHESYTVWIIFLHIFGYSISIGPLCFTYAVQILQNISVVLVTFWGLNIITSFTFDFLIESQNGVPLMFCIYFIGSFLCFIFLYKKMIETKNVPKKQIYDLVQQKSTEWNKDSIKIRPQLPLGTNKPTTQTGTGLYKLGQEHMKQSIVKKSRDLSNTNSEMKIYNSAANISSTKNLNNSKSFSKNTMQQLNKDFI